MHCFSGVESFWLVKNNQPVIDAIKKLDSLSIAFSIPTYDFFTIYKSIPHNKLKNVMREMIKLCFKDGEKQFIAVTKFGQHGLTIKTRFFKTSR